LVVQTKGLRQGCNLLPNLFNLFIREALKEIRKENIGGIKVNGILVKVLHFADVIEMYWDRIMGNPKSR